MGLPEDERLQDLLDTFSQRAAFTSHQDLLIDFLLCSGKGNPSHIFPWRVSLALIPSFFPSSGCLPVQ